jgi:hypothetical protein
MEANEAPRKEGNITQMAYTMSIPFFFKKTFAYSVTILNKCAQSEEFHIVGIK